jgi:hypothetical protein
MGLDVYLNKKTYIGNQYRDTDKQVKVIVPENQEGVFFPTGTIKNERIVEITERVAYWRKANAIHEWFVKNVQEGEDDCGEYGVSTEQLKQLIDLCKETLAYVKDQPKIEKTEKDWNGKEYTYTIYDVKGDISLPTVGGFFFGGTDYDDWYIKSLQDTIDQLEPLLEEEGDFYYQSSW